MKNSSILRVVALILVFGTQTVAAQDKGNDDDFLFSGQPWEVLKQEATYIYISADGAHIKDVRVCMGDFDKGGNGDNEPDKHPDRVIVVAGGQSFSLFFGTCVDISARTIYLNNPNTEMSVFGTFTILKKQV